MGWWLGGVGGGVGGGGWEGGGSGGKRKELMRNSVEGYAIFTLEIWVSILPRAV